ncbi:hypothetical protein [Nocardia sp. NPDC024068]|uniref:hypothetical protein n=1 Tax=Nocardia sp. NPDC024068 TaxID=3157197 RepID=UPI0033CB2057
MIGKFEANKDLIQELTSSGARRIGNIAGIITGTVAEVAREIGEWVTDAIEMNEAAAAARRDAADVPETGERLPGDPDAGHPEADRPSGVVDADPAGPDVVDADVVDADVVDAGTADPGSYGKRDR